MEEIDTLITQIPFDISGKIFRSAMPFSPYDDSGSIWIQYKVNKINAVVILAEPQEYLVHAKRDLVKFYQSEGLEVLKLPIPDFKIPEDKVAFEEILKKVISLAENGKNVAVHCMAGYGRTGTFLACLAKRHLNFNGMDAIEWIRKSIPGALENQNQEKFVREF